MSRIIYVNGDFVPADQAVIPVFDRGFLFADGVYDVSAVLDGKLAEYERHMARLKRSCSELNIRFPVSDEELLSIHRDLIEKNNLHEGMVYVQVTRGNAGDRDFTCDADVQPTLVAFTKVMNLLAPPKAEAGIKGITLPDIRWARRDIKSIALLPQTMAKFIAKQYGASVAWMVQDGYITEEASSNAHIIKDGTLITRPLSNDILAGITRRAILELLEQGGIGLDERNYTVEELYDADEAFCTSATGFVTGMIEVDGKVIGDGKVGPLTRKIRELYIEMALRESI